MNRETGKRLSEIEHLKQSIADILTTPIGSRVMRRDYGSRIFELLDAPANDRLVIDIISATAEALQRWEPRVRIDRLSVSNAAPGHITLDLYGTYTVDGRDFILEGLTI